MILLLFSRSDQDSLAEMTRIFLGNPNTVWFLEKEYKWLSLEGLTSDPLAAIKFKSKMEAITFSVNNKLEGFIATEHEFV